MMFWILASLIMLAVAGWLIYALRRGAETALTGAASDLSVYRDQLTEVDRDLAKGVLTEAEAEAVRLEVKRRLLGADQRVKAAKPAEVAGSLPAILVILALTLAGGLGLYLNKGAPGARDLPMTMRLAMLDDAAANRMGQDEAEALAAPELPQPAEPEAEFLELMEQLRQAIKERPEDVPGLMLLARNEARLGNYIEARRVQDRLIATKGDTATPNDLTMGLEMSVFSAGGYISPEAEAYLMRLLDKEPDRQVAHYFLGLLHAQNGRPDRAFPVWRRLLEDGAQDAPWVPVVRSEIAAVAAEAGVNYTPPETQGPTAEDMAAAADMSDEDRQAMIRGMVDGLAERLATDGGSVEDWAQLITALGVLGEEQRARAVFTEAQTVFGQDETAMVLIMEAGRRAGLIE